MGKRIKDTISQQMKFKVTIGIGEYHEAIRGISKSFKEATQALDVGTKLEGAGDIYHVDNLGVGKLLAEIKGESQQEFMEKTIYSVKNSKEKKINETLLKTYNSIVSKIKDNIIWLIYNLLLVLYLGTYLSLFVALVFTNSSFPLVFVFIITVPEIKTIFIGMPFSSCFISNFPLLNLLISLLYIVFSLLKYSFALL